MKEYRNIEVSTIEELKGLIQKANTLNQMDDLRYACVKFMKTDHDILKLWQDKYWSLKRCPTCGHLNDDD